MFDVTTKTPGPLSSFKSDQVYLAKQSLQLHSLWLKMIGDEDRIEFRDHRFRLVDNSFLYVLNHAVGDNISPFSLELRNLALPDRCPFCLFG